MLLEKHATKRDGRYLLISVSAQNKKVRAGRIYESNTPPVECKGLFGYVLLLLILILLYSRAASAGEKSRCSVKKIKKINITRYTCREGRWLVVPTVRTYSIFISFSI